MLNAPHAKPVARFGLSAALGAALAASLALGAAGGASAEPGPVYPSREQVEAARTATAGTAAQVSSLDARYAAATARLAQVRTQAAAAAEAYNGARLQQEQKRREAAAARGRAAKAQEQAEAASLEVRQYAAAVYQQGGSLGDLEAFLSSEGPQEMLDRASALDAVGTARDRSFQRASATSAVAETMRRQAAQAEAAQAEATQRAEQARDAAQDQAAEAERASAAVQAEQQELVSRLAELRDTSQALERQRQDGLQAAAEARAAASAAAEQARLAAARAQAAQGTAARQAAQAAAQRAQQEAARQAAAARAAEDAARRAAAQRAAEEQDRPATQPAPAPAPAPEPAPNPPAPTPAPKPPAPPSTKSGVAAVLSYARAQIGKPYEWGGSGPDTFDCSGLTLMAWRQAGVNLSHYTGAQWRETARVAISDLQPGDLVFYGTSGETSHHMGLYIGGGRMIEAPYTGAFVREASIYRSDLLPYGGRVS